MNDQHGELKYHPAQIEQIQREIADLNRLVQQARERIDNLEADLTIEIAAARGEDNKPLFSNDQVRKAAFIKRLAEDADYQKLSNELAQLEKERLYKLARLERVRLEFKLFLLDREQEISAGK